MIPRVSLLIAVALLSSSCALLGVAPPCDGTDVIAEFEQVGDLVENANVQSSDVEVGRVQNIALAGWNARVTMCLNAEERISKTGLKAIIRTTSLLGEKFVALRTTSQGPPFLEDGDVIPTERTSKAAELEDVFARLSTVLGAGNLERINQFTAAQAKILRNRAGEVREVLSRLRRFTDLLVGRKQQIASSIDSLDSVSRTIIGQSSVLEGFLASFAQSSRVLADQKEELNDLLFSLERFTKISVQLLNQTESGLNRQFDDLRPVLRTLAVNSEELARTLQTLATFTDWFPETMPGDYLQLDVCQALPDIFGPGTTCPQAEDVDDPERRASTSTDPSAPSSDLDVILRQPIRSRD